MCANANESCANSPRGRRCREGPKRVLVLNSSLRAEIMAAANLYTKFGRVRACVCFFLGVSGEIFFLRKVLGSSYRASRRERCL